MIGEEFEVFPFADELLFAIGGLGGLFKIPFGISLDGVPPLFVLLVSVDDVFKLFDVDKGDVVVVMELFALFPLLLLLLKVDKLCFTAIAGELFELLKLFAFDSILK